MAKFINSGAVASQLPIPVAVGAGAASPIGKHVPVVQVEPVHVFNTVGCWALAFCMLAPQANDWMLHLVGAKAYLYYIGYPLALAAFIFCGTTLRGLQTTVGKLWLLFAAWLMVDVPFSVWRAGSLDLVKSYLTRDVIFFFVICSLAINLRYVKFLLNVTIFGAFMVLGTCMVFGKEVSGRFMIPDSSFFGNANDLSIQLVLNIGLFGFLVSKKRFAWRVVGAGAIVLSVFYLLRTGSRGGFVAALILLIVSFLGAKNKLNVVILLIPLLLIVPMVKRETLTRLAMIYAKPEAVQVASDSDEGVIASQVSRQRLLRLSVEVSAKHPLFGVGPGQFIEATSGVDRKHGKHSPALGTHNTYTEVSSECGLVPFLCFVGALIIPMRRMRLLYKHTPAIPELQEVPQMAYAILLSLAGYAAAIFFHHVAYTGYLPHLSALAMTLFVAAETVRAKYQAAPEPMPAAAVPGPGRRPWVRSNGQ